MANVPAVIKDRFFTKLTDKHRAIARMVAIGISDAEICDDFGFKVSYLRELKKFPPFREAVDKIAGVVDHGYMVAMMRVQSMNPRSLDVLEEDLEMTPEDMQITRKYSDGSEVSQQDAQMRKVRQEAMKLQLGIQGISPIQKNQSEVLSVNVRTRLEGLTRRWSQERRAIFQNAKEHIVDAG